MTDLHPDVYRAQNQKSCASFVASWRRTHMSSTNTSTANDRTIRRCGTSTCSAIACSATCLTNRRHIRRFVCPVSPCDSTIEMWSNFDAHLCRHMCIKPHVCEYNGCEKRFTDKPSRIRHYEDERGYEPTKRPSTIQKVEEKAAREEFGLASGSQPQNSNKKRMSSNSRASNGVQQPEAWQTQSLASTSRSTPLSHRVSSSGQSRHPAPYPKRPTRAAMAPVASSLFYGAADLAPDRTPWASDSWTYPLSMGTNSPYPHGLSMRYESSGPTFFAAAPYAAETTYTPDTMAQVTALLNSYEIPPADSVYTSDWVDETRTSEPFGLDYNFDTRSAAPFEFVPTPPSSTSSRGSSPYAFSTVESLSSPATSLCDTFDGYDASPGPNYTSSPSPDFFSAAPPLSFVAPNPADDLPGWFAKSFGEAMAECERAVMLASNPLFHDPANTWQPL